MNIFKLVNIYFKINFNMLFESIYREILNLKYVKKFNKLFMGRK